MAIYSHCFLFLLLPLAHSLLIPFTPIFFLVHSPLLHTTKLRTSTVMGKKQPGMKSKRASGKEKAADEEASLKKG